MSSSRAATTLSTEITLGRGGQTSQVDQMTSLCPCLWLSTTIRKSHPNIWHDLSKSDHAELTSLSQLTNPSALVIADG